ncbi:MAG: hypothetical protein KGK08_04565 [Acidobacteriota bacterium]|nr:hypothetical protein [Acidobacteriota bacterium]
MKITLDNQDGHGALDYSACVAAEGPLEVVRTLNAPSLCRFSLYLSASGLPVPVRRARVTATSDNGTTLFTGYVATEPEASYTGTASTGPVYRYAVRAVSDEWLLDKLAVPITGAALAQPAGQLLASLASRTGAGVLSSAAIGSGAAVGVFHASPAEPWSANAGAAAQATYAAYRAVAGELTLQPAGSVAHTFQDGNGTLHAGALTTSAVRELANDVTVTGEMEPAAYVTEAFAGDGTTTLFLLSQRPYKPPTTPNTVHLVNDSFNQPGFNQQTWNVADPGSHLGLGANGLTMNGGNGLDGQTTLTLLDSVELGGSLVLEAGGVQLTGTSDGVLCGLYSGSVQRSNCFAGFNVRQSSGATVLVPFVNGTETGTVFSVQSGHTYTLRLRLHCVETQRVAQSYYAMVNGAVTAFGGGLTSAPVALVFELQDLGAASNTPATVLYDATVATSPAMATFAAVNSVQLFGSMGYSRITVGSSAWVTSTLPTGTRYTRLIGTAGEGVDCTLTSTGRLTFLAGRVPIAGEIVTIVYRTERRAIARRANQASVAAEAASGVPGTASWLGKVLRPPARSSADCEAAALAILSFASSRAAAAAGTYTAVNPGDVWPGDLLAISQQGNVTNYIVRKVHYVDGHSQPEVLTCHITFANDWAEGLGLKLSESVALDAYLPAAATSSTAPVGSGALANLQQLQIVSASLTVLQIDAGVAPPTGGGFEVRTRDWTFGAGVDQNLVLRSPVRSFSIPRAAQVERYYIRMYDGANPPNYSRFSSAVWINLPVG